MAVPQASFPRSEGYWDLEEDRRGASTERRELAAIVVAIWRNRFGLVFSGLLVAILTWIGTGFITPMYTSSAHVRVDGDGLDALNDRLAEPMGFIDPTAIMTRIEALKSLSVMDDAAENAGARFVDRLNPGIDSKRLKADKDAEPQYDVSGYGAVVLNFSESVSIGRVGTSGVAEISVSSHDPLFAARAANAVGAAFIDKVLREKRTQQLDAIDILLRQIEETSADLKQLEARILHVREENQVLLHGDTFNDARLQEMSRTQGLITGARAELAETRRRLEIVDSVRAAGGKGDALNLVSFSQLVNDLRAQRASLEVAFVQVQANYGAQHPKYIKAKEALDTVDRSIQGELDRIHQSIRNEAQEIARRIAALEEQLDQTEAQIDTEAVGRVRLASLEDEATSLRRALSSFTQQIDSVENTLLLQSPEASFIATAAVPEFPYFPRRKVMVVAVGFCWGALYILVISTFAVLNPRLRTSEDVKQFERAIGCNVVSVLPKFRRKPATDYLKIPDENFVRSIEHVAARLGISFGGNRVIVVSPAESGSGGSSVAVALAASIASAGIKTLIIELDSRQKLSRYFGTSGALGLTNYGASDGRARTMITSTSIPGLDFLPHGHFDDGFDGRAFDCLYHILDELILDYDTIIVSTRPLEEAPRTADLCQVANAIVVVAKPLRNQAALITRNLRQVSAELRNSICVVFNLVDRKTNLLG
jgi:uncharacterized protein involved in exopolysaccharide biosynthesis